jgi:hypothetical protein
VKSVTLRIHAMQGDYDGKPKSRHWKLQMHLAAKPAGVSRNGEAARWNYDTKKRVLRLDWNAATAEASEVVVTR